MISPAKVPLWFQHHYINTELIQPLLEDKYIFKVWDLVSPPSTGMLSKVAPP